MLSSESVQKLHQVTSLNITQVTSRWGTRYYNVEGEKLTSVTTILNVIDKPALKAWAARMEREYMLDKAVEHYRSVVDDPSHIIPNSLSFRLQLEQTLDKKKAYQLKQAEAVNIGKLGHEAIEYEIRKELGQEVGEPNLTSFEVLGVREALSGYYEWRDIAHFRPWMVEQVLYSKAYGYAGTCDVIGWTDGGLITVLDWKTGSGIYPESLLQISAYVMAICEMGHCEPPVRGCIVRLPKTATDPDVEVKMIEWEELQDAFIAFLAAKRVYDWHQVQNEKAKAVK